MTESNTTMFLRQAALRLGALGSVAATVDLLLLGHTQKPTQWIPFMLLSINAVFFFVLQHPNPQKIRAYQIFCVFMLLGGAFGVGFHYLGNLEIAHEVNPDNKGLAFLFEGMRGGNPVLAPGLFAQIGLLGLMFSHHHPVQRTQPTAVVG